jgi:N-acylneuraminate cytidylyltransferase
MKIISLILARGGSKGIPEKNIINLKGYPLIKYVIDASLQSNVHETWVSTDSKKIKLVAQSHGSQVVDRPSEFSTDISSSEEAILHFCTLVQFDILVFIQPTSPLLLSQDIDKGLSLLLNSDSNYDSIFSVYKEHWIPRWTLDCKPKNWDLMNRPRRQDKKEVYVENGALYISTKKQILNSKLRYSGNIGCIEMPLQRSFQVDTYEDLKLIDKLL